DARARSYLHVNCSHCHRLGAGGSVDFSLQRGIALESSKVLEARPIQGTFGIAGAQVLAAGDPDRSVLYYRMAKPRRGRMPHTGCEVGDERGLGLIHSWIRQLPLHKEEHSLLKRLRELDEPVLLERERSELKDQVQRISFRVARERGRKAPLDADRKE